MITPSLPTLQIDLNVCYYYSCIQCTNITGYNNIYLPIYLKVITNIMLAMTGLCEQPNIAIFLFGDQEVFL